MAGVPSTSSTSHIQTEFDYDGVKKRYMRQVELYYLNKNLSTNAPWTRKAVEKIKSLIKEGIRLQEIGYPSPHQKYKIMDTYEIITENGVQKLIYKRANANDRVIEIVGAEDCFDIVVDAHIKTDHGGYGKIMNSLRNKYSLPKSSIEFIINFCNVCSANVSTESKRRAENEESQHFNARGQVSLINMTLEPDQEFKYILFYLDRFTKYMILRPLITNSHNEVAMELLKIFFDFGPPENLETYDRVYFGRVLKVVRTVHVRFHNISLMLPVKLPEISAITVKNMLKKWKQQSGSRNWAMGCYMVQWESNCAVIGDDQSPYQSVFNMKPWYSFYSRNKSFHRRDDSRNDAFNTNIDYDSIDDLEDGDIFIAKDYEDDKTSDTSEVAEITEENGDIIATLPLTSAKQKTPANINKFSKRDVTMAEPSTVRVGIPMPGKSVQPGTSQDLDNIASIITKAHEMSENLKCHVCKTAIAKPYTCVKCKRYVHLFCSDRLMKQDVPLDVLSVTCTACTILMTRIKRIEQKSKKIADDQGKVVLNSDETVAKKRKIT